MGNLILRFIREEDGQDLVEYAFLIVFIALAIIGVLTTFRGNIETLFTDTGNAIATS
jgi:Flp pilus assembly pilin Flp